MKKLLLSVFAILFCFSAFAQFGEPEKLSFSSRPEKAIVNDIDQDGDEDIVIKTLYDEIVWRENLGGGSFGYEHTILDANQNVANFRIADLDGDTDEDVLLVDQVGDHLSWIENLGNGEFGSQHTISLTVDGAYDMFAADFDGDGDNDVLCGSMMDSTLAWYENSGTGVFTNVHVLNSSTWGVRMVGAKDFDGDGDIDVMAAYGGTGLTVYENLGGGVFGAQQLVATSSPQPTSAYSYDLDGDGDFDLLTGSYSDHHITWHENLGGLTFGPEQLVADSVWQVQSVHAADLDGDSDLDIVACAVSYNEFLWYENDGTGTFGPPQLIDQTFSGGGYGGVTLDVNNDGALDVIRIGGYVQHLAWYQNLGAGNFGPSNTICPEISFPHANELSDLDGDGDLDIVVGGHDGGQIGWFENTGNGEFSLANIVTDQADSLVDITTGDVDGDGLTDILYAGKDRVAWYRNLGGGTFGNQMIVDTLVSGALCVLATDLDADGDLDVVSSSFHDWKVFYHENLGGGTFAAQQQIAIFGFAPFDLELEDIDGDGDLDIAGLVGLEIFWIENLGTGSFPPHNVLTTFQNNITEFEFVDLDGDAHNDILGVQEYDNQVVWHKWFSNGTFSNAQIISAMINTPQHVSAADFDNDGDMDVVATSAGFDFFSWFENLGGGAFGIIQDVSTTVEGPRLALTEDIDGDGDYDISFIGEGCVMWVPNHRYHATQISGQLFVDANQNGIFDTTEIGINQIGVMSNPASDFTYTYSDGKYIHNFSDVAGSYLIQPQTLPYWSIVTDSLSYTVVVDSTFTPMDSLDFGFYPDTIAPAVEAVLTGGFPRCLQTTNYWINVSNIGTTTPSGSIALQLDTALTYVGANVAPDSVVGQHLYWSYDSLSYFEEEAIKVHVQMPGWWAMGNNLQSYLTATVIDSAGTNVFQSTDTLDQILVCAYDPNDKAVTPAGVGPQGYILPSVEQLDYLVRFQNTGNDTAFNVVIKDQLSMHLDWQSLTPIASSHSVQVTVDQDGEASFAFYNIMLPDSNVNELESHGFVRFTIDLLPNLPLGTSIYNTAHIFFDFNPAVITNTTINTIDICFDNTPAVIEPFADDTICIEHLPVALPNASPAGGTYIGAGVSGNQFDPLLAGLGTHYVTYEYLDVDGCVMLDSTYILVEVCSGIEESTSNSFVARPNPFTDHVTLTFAAPLEGNHTIQLVNILGDEVYSRQLSNSTQTRIDRGKLAPGVYFITLTEQASGNVLQTTKLVIR